jgi:cytochrome b subunit of formate dehydrogenase
VLRHPGLLRLIHWSHVVITLILAVTGLYLDRPFLPRPALRVATVRLTHLTAAPLFVASLAFHLVYSLTSGSWRDLWPDRRDWRSLGGVVKHEALLSEAMPMHGKYHVLQKLLYLSFLPVALAEAATGWSMAAPTTWSGSLLIRGAGDLGRIRLLHYLLALYLVATATLHLYRILSEPGSLAAMLTGWASDVPPADTAAEKATRPPRWR